MSARCREAKHNWRRLFWWSGRIMACVVCGSLGVKTSRLHFSLFQRAAVSVEPYGLDYDATWHEGV